MSAEGLPVGPDDGGRDPLLAGTGESGTPRIVLAGLLGGAALPVAWIAWLNRYGPGDHCVAIDGGQGQECAQQWSPWPWVVAAVAVLGAAAWLLGTGVARARSTGRGSAWLAVGWAVVGLLTVVGVLGVLTIGVFVLPAAALLGAWLASRRRAPAQQTAQRDEAG